MHNFSRQDIEYYGHRDLSVVANDDKTTWVRVLGSFDMLLLNSDVSLTPAIKAHGFWEAWISSWFTRNIQPGQTVLDIGANNGYYTMLSEELVGDEGKVIAYEPNPDNVKLLEASKERNDFNYTIRPVAVADQKGKMNLHIPGDYVGSASLTADFSDGSWGKETLKKVNVTTLDEEFKKGVFDNVDLIKMDVEGAEQLVWNGGKELLSSLPNCIIALEWTPNAYSPEFFDELSAWGDLSVITYDGREAELDRSWLEAQTDWVMIVVRKKRLV
jgi:FkbM family methyltransferase